MFHSLARLIVLSILSAGISSAYAQTKKIGPPVDIVKDTTLSGLQRVEGFSVSQGVTLSLSGNLTVESVGDVTISGDITVASGKPVVISITSSSGIVRIAGNIRLSSGLAGADGPIACNSRASNGTDGSSFYAAAPKGLLIVSGSISTGDGGDGGNATVLSLDGCEATARAGEGGSGGSIELIGLEGVEIQGHIASGDGGSSGTSLALNLNEERPSQARALSLNGGVGAAIATCSAGNRANGKGGIIAIESTGGPVIIGSAASIISGDGGTTESASADATYRATAYVEEGGNGGDIAICVPEDMRVQTLGLVQSGNGGDSGEAQATVSGEGDRARARSNGGGWPGLLIGHAAAIGKQRTAGNTGASIAEFGAKTETDPARKAKGATPAWRTDAELP